MTSTVTLGGSPIRIEGQFPQPGQKAPPFTLVGKDLADVTLASLAGKRKILNIFPSIDTPTCATSVRKFNERAAALADTVVILRLGRPAFAQSRFCGAEGARQRADVSTMRGAAIFGCYGVEIASGPFRRCRRAGGGRSRYQRHRQVQSAGAGDQDEPDYEAALHALK